jgi:HSP20 family molecular chaperone IbpA
LKAHKRHVVLMRAALPAGVDTEKIEASFKTGVRTGTVPKKSPAQKPEKKIEIVRH